MAGVAARQNATPGGHRVKKGPPGLRKR
jgi:hypothetical protein